MCYPDQKYYIMFFFQRYKDFEVSIKYNQTKGKGRPKIHSDSSLVVFFDFMELRGINRFKAQHLFLLTHADWLKRFKFKSVPDRTTLSRRYKQLTLRIEQFVEYLGDLGVSLDTQTPREVVFEDKSLYKAQGSVWHQKDRKANPSPKDCATWIQMRVGQQASIADGFMGMDFISQLLPTDFHGSPMFILLL